MIHVDFNLPIGFLCLAVGIVAAVIGFLIGASHE